MDFISLPTPGFFYKGSAIGPMHLPYRKGKGENSLEILLVRRFARVRRGRRICNNFRARQYWRMSERKTLIVQVARCFGRTFICKKSKYFITRSGLMALKVFTPAPINDVTSSSPSRDPCFGRRGRFSNLLFPIFLETLEAGDETTLACDGLNNDDLHC